jgi:hypothetical protein
MYSEQTLARFWSKVARCPHGDGCEQCCWEWQASKKVKGYGQFYIRIEETNRYSNRGAHRIAWSIHNGAVPDGMQVMHKCDNPPCVNPTHLQIGTHIDNMQDAINKGRIRRNPTSLKPKSTEPSVSRALKLCARDVIAIRRAHIRGTSIKGLAEAFTLHKKTVQEIVRRKIWKHLP